MKGFVRVVLFATGLALGFAPITAHAAGPFTESGGIVVFEAEDFASQDTHGNPHSWVLTNTVAGFSGTGYMEALPNLDNPALDGGSSWLTNTPELKYTVNFTTTATHRSEEHTSELQSLAYLVC